MKNQNLKVLLEKKKLFHYIKEVDEKEEENVIAESIHDDIIMEVQHETGDSIIYEEDL